LLCTLIFFFLLTRLPPRSTLFPYTRSSDLRLVIRCTHAQAPAVCEALAAILAPWRPGPCPITVEYAGATACGALTLGEEWTVRRSEEHTSELQSLAYLVCRLLLEKKKKKTG